ncbi:MAG TPA: penicillin acylase family protein [Usitatibacteraceae bacterium]|nr:penicillin acylase family protein [Usitatibacteraceae bacterium]
MIIRPGRTVALVAFGAACLGASTAIAQNYSAEVRRTSFGVAHVKAADYGGIGYGVGYAFAQDNFCMAADEFVTVRGERSRYFGESGTTPYQRNNLVSDFYYTLVNADAAPLAAGLNGMSAETRAAFRGWVAGFNRYLRDTGVANLPAPCKDAAWVRPIDEVDMMRLVRRYLLEASTNNFMEGMVAAKPPSASTGKSLTRLGPKSDAGIPGFDQDYWPTWRSDIGSNALALGRDATDNGRGLLLGNPHFPWSGTLRFYQFHVTIPNEIDVMGGSLSGFPLINIGFNKDVAWSHTNDVAWHFTIYQLKLDPANPTKYVYDGQTRDMTTKTVTVQVKNADGTLSSKSNTFYLSHFGPVTTSSALPIPWTSSFAYAIRETNLDNWRLADQWRAINKATSTADVKAALQSIVGIPWVNTTAADREGNVFYGDISTAPNVPREKQSLCTPDVTFAVVFSLKGPPVLDGSRSFCEWDDVSGAPQAGLIPGGAMPFIDRHDFAQNSNDSYWLANPAVETYRWDIPAVVGVVPDVQGMRTRLGVLQAQARLAGTDGRTGNRFSLANLQEIALSNRSLTADLYMPDVMALCQGSAAAAVQAECGALSAWDRQFELASRGAHLFREFFNAARSIANVYRVPFNYLDPVNTPRGFNVDSPALATALAAALKTAGDKVRGAGLAIDAPLGTVQFTLRGATPIPVHGGEENLGIYNKVSSALVPNLGYVITTGTSYIQTVQYTDAGVNAQGFLSYSQSTDPASPHFSDQTMRFMNKQWITFPFTEAQITSDPAYSTMTIQE